MFSQVELDRLIAAMRANGVAMLEVRTGDDLLKLELAQDECASVSAAAPNAAAPDCAAAKSPCIGQFVPRGLDDGLAPLETEGLVHAGDTLGYIAHQHARALIVSPMHGVLTGEPPQAGRVFGYNDTVFTVEASSVKIDLNSDLGEGFGAYTIADDAALMQQISSANVACGYHAGDPMIMDRTIRLAKEHGVDLGAHVSFPDLMGFGRRKMEMAAPELEAHILYQLGALDGLARRAGHDITHINPHGALGNMASSDPLIAQSVAKATMDFDPNIAFLVLPGSALEKAAEDLGGRVVRLFLADRGYLSNGQLAPRGQAGGVIHDPALVVERVLGVLDTAHVTTVTGEVIPMPVQSILIHSDTAGAVDLATRLRHDITAAGGVISPLSQHI